MKWTVRGLSFVLAALCLSTPVLADRPDADTQYCFGAPDFEAEDCAGICLTDLPDTRLGLVQLGDRVLRPGDVLTASQAAQMTFAPRNPEVNQVITVSYLPIRQGHLESQAAMQLTLRGRTDQPPVAEDSAFETYKNLEVTNRLKVTEPENQPMTFAVQRQPRRGTVTILEDGSFTYTPKKNKIGVDSFTYTATDSTGQTSREATVTVTILRPIDGAKYADTAGKDCCFAAEWMKNTGIFSGERLGEKDCFGPEKPVTQGEFLTMLVRTLDIPAEEELSCAGYEDAPQWLRPYLAAAVRSGLISHFPSFQSDAVMEQDSVQSILCALTDTEATTAFAQDAQPLTRADAAMLLYDLSQQRASRKTQY